MTQNKLIIKTNEPIVKTMDEAGFITFTQRELTDLLKQSYNRGYNDGLNPLVSYDDNGLISNITENTVIQLVQE